MIKRLVITDLSRMKEPHVCVFGVDNNREGIRPTLPPSGIDEDYAMKNNLKPFNEVEFDLIPKYDIKPPHTEDWLINTIGRPKFIRNLSSNEIRNLLEELSYKKVKDIFGAEIHERQYLDENSGERSLGTIRVKEIESINYYEEIKNNEVKYKYRIKFWDMNNDFYDFPITDLAFRYYCNNLRKKDNNLNIVSSHLTTIFKNGAVFIRVGLARPYKKMYDRCYLQVPGIYRFPNYLEDVENIYENKEKDKWKEYGKKYSILDSKFEQEEWQTIDVISTRELENERQNEVKNRSNMDINIDNLFPFSSIRFGQREMLEDVRKTIASNGILIAQASTGIGKTAASIAPALEYAIKNDKLVMFLTSKQSQHKIVVDTLKLIKNQKNVNFTAIDIISKQDMCPRNIAKEHYILFNELCKLGQKTGECVYYKHHDKDVLSHLTENILHVEELKNICTSKGACPYKTALSAIADAHVLICDYNYVFSDIFENILDKTKHSLHDIILIIDESHNLVNRINKNFSYELTLNAINDAIREVKSANIENGMLYNYLTNVAKFFNKFSENYSDDIEQNIEKEDIIKGINAALQESLEQIDYNTFVYILKDVFSKIAEHSENYNKNEPFHIKNMAEFLEGWNKDMPYSRSFHNNTFSLKLLDSSIIAKDIISNAHATIMMSGTLYPMEMYADILGAAKEKTSLKEYNSPFPKENRLIVVTRGLTTLYEKRNEVMYQNIAKEISKIADVIEKTVQGNTAVFFPSYAFLNDVSKYFEANEKILVESKNMSKEEKNEIYSKLKNKCGNILMGVQGGSLSEGVDYENNMLKAVIIVGLPLSPPTLEVKNLVNYYTAKFGKEKGNLYGYTYPAITKVIQSAGRCIRSETDIGAIILMEDRFLLPKYKRCFPPDYEIIVTGDVPEICEKFFKSDFVLKSLEEQKKKIENKKDIKEDLGLKILNLMKSLDFDVGRTFLAEIMNGSKSKGIINKDMNKSEYYGILKEYTLKQTIGIIDQLIDGGYFGVKQTKTTYFSMQILYLTDKGEKAIENKEKIELKLSTESKTEREKQQVQELIQETLEKENGNNDKLGLNILSLIENMDFPAGRSFLASILTGSKSKELINQNIDKSEYYGILKGYTRNEAVNIIDQIIDKGYLAVKQSETTNFPRPLLYLTELGKNALDDGDKIEVKLPINIKDRTDVSKNSKLLNELKFWRRKVAEEENIPAYCVFHDTTLIEISNSLPSSISDLMKIRGFGKKRIEKYGDDVLEIVRTYISDDKNLRIHTSEFSENVKENEV